MKKITIAYFNLHAYKEKNLHLGLLFEFTSIYMPHAHYTNGPTEWTDTNIYIGLVLFKFMPRLRNSTDF